MAYAETYLLDLDQLMQRYKRFQTREDWLIERRARRKRMLAYASGAASFILFRSLTLSDEAILSRIDPYSASELVEPRGHWLRPGFLHKWQKKLHEPQGPISQYYRWLLGVKRFPLKHGAAQFFVGFVPAYITFTSLHHWSQNERLNKYLKQETVFGELSRLLVRGNSPEAAVAAVRNMQVSS
eukprot:NODE_8124_length_707_cov_47.720890_g7505_i0.p1 GENE.NODE_8124_length_707_cov_47.720890_g7505_i0~~NODE_8124_length_707_cov_47.720890_g7505_i0.p1  ORF type:complete len:183 (-),score=14.90 NODE_8124_length_707_cov_47.720890_g7505_i0:106-654(-)